MTSQGNIAMATTEQVFLFGLPLLISIPPLLSHLRSLLISGTGSSTLHISAGA
jgi:hypothetical protein